MAISLPQIKDAYYEYDLPNEFFDLYDLDQNKYRIRHQKLKKKRYKHIKYPRKFQKIWIARHIKKDNYYIVSPGTILDIEYTNEKIGCKLITCRLDIYPRVIRKYPAYFIYTNLNKCKFNKISSFIVRDTLRE